MKAKGKLIQTKKNCKNIIAYDRWYIPKIYLYGGMHGVNENTDLYNYCRLFVSS